MQYICQEGALSLQYQCNIDEGAGTSTMVPTMVLMKYRCRILSRLPATVEVIKHTCRIWLCVNWPLAIAVGNCFQQRVTLRHH